MSYKQMEPLLLQASARIPPAVATFISSEHNFQGYQMIFTKTKRPENFRGGALHNKLTICKQFSEYYKFINRST